ncbi:hypothetical protein F5144DRAFT_568376 [Chaetomium tenue]|uniref:Uncharacterized protein n=1 Tax=Chaetomium tenue TaxID=1854479 RepID=A0ACB7PFD3_9PEZI|nr:hypothetical protein F5144DRAFT_568376 [Chaetomium globosum]
MQSTRSIALARTLRGACRAPSHTARRYITTRTLTSTTSLTQQGQPQTQHKHQTIRLPQTQTQTRHYASPPTTSTPLQKTPLHALHLAHGAKLVPFGGFEMPVQYSNLSVSESHLFTRAHASLFDVSHMVQRVFSGPGAAAFLERVTPAGIAALAPGRSTLAVLMREDGSGGIVDDLMVTRLEGEGRFYVVTNAACREKDDAYFGREVGKWNGEVEGEGLGVVEERWSREGLVALQGPEAEGILKGVLAEGEELNLRRLGFGQSAWAKLKMSGGGTSSAVLISRGGYTGEDGFEISILAEETVGVTEALLEAGGPEKVQLAGLGARDSLRLEAGLCLYGHDLSETTTPVDASLRWVVSKKRRGPDAGYYGAEVISQQFEAKSQGQPGVDRRRVGLIVEGAPAREGAKIVTRAEDGQEPVEVGVITSGCPSPTLGKNIAMGYVDTGFHKVGREVDVLVRGRPRKAVVAKMPFVATKYFKGEKEKESDVWSQ